MFDWLTLAYPAGDTGILGSAISQLQSGSQGIGGIYNQFSGSAARATDQWEGVAELAFSSTGSTLSHHLNSVAGAHGGIATALNTYLQTLEGAQASSRQAQGIISDAIGTYQRQGQSTAWRLASDIELAIKDIPFSGVADYFLNRLRSWVLPSIYFPGLEETSTPFPDVSVESILYDVESGFGGGLSTLLSEIPSIIVDLLGDTRSIAESLERDFASSVSTAHRIANQAVSDVNGAAEVAAGIIAGIGSTVLLGLLKHNTMVGLGLSVAELPADLAKAAVSGARTAVEEAESSILADRELMSEAGHEMSAGATHAERVAGSRLMSQARTDLAADEGDLTGAEDELAGAESHSASLFGASRLAGIASRVSNVASYGVGDAFNDVSGALGHVSSLDGVVGDVADHIPLLGTVLTVAVAGHQLQDHQDLQAAGTVAGFAAAVGVGVLLVSNPIGWGVLAAAGGSFVVGVGVTELVDHYKGVEHFGAQSFQAAADVVSTGTHDVAAAASDAGHAASDAIHSVSSWI